MREVAHIMVLPGPAQRAILRREVECQVSREAVIELMEERGDSACPFCGRPPEAHDPEVEWDEENERIPA